jgi:hypothetical protein
VLTAAKMPPKETIGSRNYKGTKKIRHGVDGGKNASERDNWELKLQRYKKYDMVLTAAKMPPKETIRSWKKLSQKWDKIENYSTNNNKNNEKIQILEYALRMGGVRHRRRNVFAHFGTHSVLLGLRRVHCECP